MTEWKPRKHERFPVNLQVDCQTKDAFLANRVSNLSQGGLFIPTEDPLPVQSELDLVLEFHEGTDSIRARGRVIWNYDIRKGTSRVIRGMGIKFLDLAPDDSRRLADYLATLQPAPPSGTRAEPGPAPRPEPGT